MPVNSRQSGICAGDGFAPDCRARASQSAEVVGFRASAEGAEQLTNGYDLDYRLSSLQAAGATTLQNLTLSYDPASNISGITDGVAANLSQTFQYDLLGHVTKGTGVFGTDNYTYDAMGNRLTRSLVNGSTSSTTYTYTTASTRLASAATGSSTLSYTYDAMGSVTARKLGNTTQAAYTYNADARLATAGGATLKYNAFGQRQVETVTGGGTHFLFGPDGALLAEHSVSGALVRNYVYLNGKPLAVVDAAGTSATSSPTTSANPRRCSTPAARSPGTGSRASTATRCRSRSAPRPPTRSGSRGSSRTR